MLKNFLTYSTLGDVIYSLCVTKILGGGNLLFKLRYLDEFCQTVLGWPLAWDAQGRSTDGDYESLRPLLLSQDYIHNVKLHENEPIDVDFLATNWQFHLPHGWQCNQTEMYALTVGLDIHDPQLFMWRQVGYTVADVLAKCVFGLTIFKIARMKSEAEGMKEDH